MIISKEESQGQVQVYIEEIIQENPGDKEENFRASCDILTGDGNKCKDSSGKVVDYCENLAVTCTATANILGLGCKPRCDLFKRGRCDDTNYCKWTVDNICECSEEGPVTPTCSDSDGDGYTGTPAGCGPDCDDNNPLIGGGGKCEDVSCTNTSECAYGLECKFSKCKRK